MRKLRKKVFMAAGSYTVSFGPGRREFHPKKPRPGLEHYLNQAGAEAIGQINDPHHIDEAVVGNFMAARFNKQGHLAALLPDIDPALMYKPCTRVEGACASGGLALYTGMKSILAETADVALVVGVEVQNTVKAVYGADYLAGAGHYATERKGGHAFFPAKFDDRAAAYGKRFGIEQTREAMALWYVQAIENARKEPKAQEYHNQTVDLLSVGMTPANPRSFLANLNPFDCSKVSDGAAAIFMASEEGLKKIGIEKSAAVEIVAFGQAEANLTQAPEDLTKLTTTAKAAEKAYETAQLTPADIGLLELHDCFTITGLLALEACGFADYGAAGRFVESGKTAATGVIPTNLTGGLIGYGHYTGGTGVRQAVDCWRQLTGKSGDCQVASRADRPYAMMVNMGGNDKTVTTMIFKRA